MDFEKISFGKKWLVVLGIILFIFFVNWFYLQFPTKQSDSSSCKSCHVNITGFSSSHAKLECNSCHLGNPNDFTKGAHQDMVSIPGNLDDVSSTCAQAGCHVGIDQRVKHSLMNTMSGVVAVDKFIFGESMDLNEIHHIESLKHTASDTHLRQLCASCHLGNKKNTTGPISELSRGGGCNACHLNYSKNAKQSHDKYVDSEFTDLPKIHPQLSLNVSDNHCFGCHSRSARISTNYEGWHEMSKEDTIIDSKTRKLKDGRNFKFIQDDVHHKIGLNCIDCHSAKEVMGDGNLYAHEEDAVKIQCEDCHNKDTPKTLSFSDLDFESQKIIALRKLPKDVKYVLGKNGNPLINVYLDADQNLQFIGKISKKKMNLSSPSTQCTQNAHKRITCEACHTSWAPQCISCHTSFDTTKLRYDYLAHQKYQGKWIEKGEFYKADFPTLGVLSNGKIEEIKTFIQGMTMTLDKSRFTNNTNDVQHVRRFAPTFAHTISKKGQTCSNCHRNPVALGYGRGKLVFNSDDQRWTFHSQFMKSNADNLPLDAWIDIGKENGTSTRIGARSLNKIEQYTLLKVGACLTCHSDSSKVSQMMLLDFDKALDSKTDNCISIGNNYDKFIQK